MCAKIPYWNVRGSNPKELKIFLVFFSVTENATIYFSIIVK